MKKVLIVIFAILAVACLVACENNQNKNEKYQKIIDEYKGALASYNLDDLDADEKLLNAYKDVNLSIIQHLARYSDNGLQLSFGYYDIDKNGTDELFVGVSGAYGAIYSYDESTKNPVKIFYLDTLERGSLSIYDNGIIFSEGAGGAALHYFEFGKITQDGVGYNALEKIEEEYFEGVEFPDYRNSDTGTKLEYKSYDEIMEKYVSGSQIVEIKEN